MAYGMLTKPSKVERQRDVWKARADKAKRRYAATKNERQLWMALSLSVRLRDGGRCRICRTRTSQSGDPAKLGSAHHIRYRSAGGTDDMLNLIWLCAVCHEREHRHEIDIRGTANKLKYSVHLKADRRLTHKERRTGTADALKVERL